MGQGMRNVATVLSGATLAQIVSIAVSPVISRIYQPDAYGLLGTFSAVLILLSTLAGLAYPAAIVIPGRDETARILAALGIACGILLSISLFIPIIIFHAEFVEVLKLGDAGAVVYLLPLLIALESLYQAGLQWMIRKQHYAQIARVNFFQALISAGLKVGGGLVAPSSGMLIVTSMLAVPINAISLYHILNRGFLPTRWPGLKTSRTEILAVAKGFRDFPLYRAPQSLTAALGQNFPPLLIIHLMGAKAAGLYVMSNGLLGIPVQILSRTVYDVFMVKLSRTVNAGGRTFRPVARATGLLAVVGIFPFCLVMSMGPWLFATMLGAGWGEAGEYARWGALLSFFSIVSRPCYCAMAVLRMQGLLLTFELANIVVRVLALVGASLHFGGNLAPIIALSLAGTVMSMIQIFGAGYICIRHDERVALGQI